MIRRDNATCPRCEGDGFIITDWERFVQPYPGDDDYAAITDCPVCKGEVAPVAVVGFRAKSHELLRRIFRPTDAELARAERNARENGL